MTAARNRRILAIGLVTLTVGMVTAWAVEADPEIQPSPAEEILATLAEEGGDAFTEAEVNWDLPVTRNEQVDRWIRVFQTTLQPKMHLWLERRGAYEPMIRMQLRARGMPEDLIYLALIESGFSPKAYSRAHASGLWQFIEETGKRYGLEVNDYVDERRDPVKATRAALDYLEVLHKRFGSWYLAAAAYNSGENRVERILRERAGGAKGDEELFWRIAEYLPRETRDYVPLMLAAGHIGKEPAKYGFHDLKPHAPLAFETVPVPGGTPLRLVARATYAEEDDIADLNPHLVRKLTPPGTEWRVRVPVGRKGLFAQNFPALLEENRTQLAKAEAPAPRGTVRHTVRKGETLTHLARRYGTSVTAIQAANGGINPRRVRAGSQLVVPTANVRVAAAGSRQSASSASSKASRAQPRYHSVRRGDTVWGIAKRYDISVGQVQNWNKLGSRSRIVPGQRLRVSA